jgi:hypothetical protein
MSTKLDGRRVLILNSDMRPLTSCNWRRGVVMVLEGTAIVLELARDRDGNTVPIRSTNMSIDLPSVVLVPSYVKMDDGVRYSRYNCYQRDDFTCQYCGDEEAELTVDHVRPKADIRETGDEGPLWRNRVTACCRCNGQKGSRSLDEMRGQRTWNGRPFKLLRDPEPPNKAGVSRFLRLVNRNNLEWLDYVPNWRRVAARVGKSWLIRAYEERSGEAVLGEADGRHEPGPEVGGGSEAESRGELGKSSSGEGVEDKRGDVASRGGRRAEGGRGRRRSR